jgi:hypothetical protein
VLYFLKYVTLQKGVQGDGCPPAGARGVLAKLLLFLAPPQAAREEDLNRDLKYSIS